MSLSNFTASDLFSWLFNPYAVGTVSLVLIGVGSTMVLRDVLRNRRTLSTHFAKAAAASSPPPPEQPDGGGAKDASPISPDVMAVPPPPMVPAQQSAPHAFQHLARVIADVRSELTADHADETAARDPSMESSWHALNGRLDRLFADVEPLLAPIRVTLSQQGEPRWGLANRSFGTYRRVNLDRTSIGWLRSEITTEGVLRFRLRTHKPSMALLNAEGVVELGRLGGPELARALTAALIPVTRYAAWNDTQSRTASDMTQAVPDLIEEAVDIANGALVEARAALKRQAKPDARSGTPQEVLLDVLVDGRQVALMRLNETERGLDVSVGVPDPMRLDLTRRQTLASDRLVAYDLAETMATCAWPALAHALGSAAAASAVRTGTKA